MLKRAAIAAVLLCVSACGQILTGQARIIDADTVEIAGVSHRLAGIDAPERRQTCRTANGKKWPCGKLATQALKRKVANNPITCHPQKNKDRYGRYISVCWANGENLNAWLVRNGWALAYRKYSKAYMAEERQAQTNRQGIWSGTFIKPWEWRRG